jgi:SAM-dependent methyltransferase
MDIATVKQRQQAAWAAGDDAVVGSRLLLTAELLRESVDLRAGQRVLDVACGSGNAALAAARRFCQVTCPPAGPCSPPTRSGRPRSCSGPR